MKSSIGLIIFFLVFFNHDGNTQPESAQWTHPYSNSTGCAWLELPPVERAIETIFDFNSVTLPEPVIQTLCGDIFGSKRQTLIGLPESRVNLMGIDFDQGVAENLLPTQPSGQLLQLSHLTDFDRDGALDVVYSATQETEAPRIFIYSPSRQEMLFQMQNLALIEPFFVFTVADVDYDQGQELILFDRLRPGQSPRVQLWNMTTQVKVWEEILPGIVDPGTVALLQDDFFESSILALGTQADGNAANVLAYEFIAGIPPQRLWSQPIRDGLTVQRVSIGKTIQGEDTVVVGFRSTDPGDSQSVRTVSELTLYDGQLVNEVAISGVDCRDLSVSQLDDDEELEIVFLDGRDDFHRLDFSQNRNRILTVASSLVYIGAGDMVQSQRPENAIIQKVGTRISIHPLSEDLDPYGPPAFLSLRATLIGRPILGDTNGNDKAEILFITESNGVINANRLGYYDPDTGGSAVEGWGEY